jgi:hypothetical protein
MRKGTGLVIAVGIGALMVAGALRASGAEHGLFAVVDRVNHAAFDVAERIFHRGADHEASTERIEVRVRDHAPDHHAERRRVEAAEQSTEFTWSGVLAAGKHIAIRGISGTIHAEPASGNEVEVVAVKTARRSDPNDVRIEVIEHADGVTVCAVYPGTRSDDCSSSDDAVRRNIDVQVEFDVRVPAGVAFLGSTVNGDVEVEGALTKVDVNTVNGDIVLEAAGETRANTVNGSIDAEISAQTLTGPVELNTVNGGIELDLPDGVDADLTASWVNGSFASDLPFQMQSRRDRRATGLFGAGGPRIEVGTVNGSIEIND